MQAFPSTCMYISSVVEDKLAGASLLLARTCVKGFEDRRRKENRGLRVSQINTSSLVREQS